MISNALTSAFGQLFAVLILIFIVYKVNQFFSKYKERFFEYVGIKNAVNQFDKTYGLILITVVLRLPCFLSQSDLEFFRVS